MEGHKLKQQRFGQFLSWMLNSVSWILFLVATMWDVAFAQTAQAPAGPSTLVSLVPLLLVFVIFYLLLIRPQQKKLKDHREMLAKLKKNDEVMTSGGIYGKVVALSDKDQSVMLEVAPNVRLRVHRPQIASLIKPEKVPAKEAKEQ